MHQLRNTVKIIEDTSYSFISKYVSDNEFQNVCNLFTFEKALSAIPMGLYSVCSFLLTDNRYIALV